jgi:hypothetical protein
MRNPTDVDVLVVCETDVDVRLMRRELAGSEQQMPLDVYLMARHEEEHLEFVTGERCVPLLVWAKTLPEELSARHGAAESFARTVSVLPDRR